MSRQSAEADSGIIGAPDFGQRLQHVESLALAGIETPQGPQQFCFRGSVEMEFELSDPRRFRDKVCNNTTLSPAAREAKIALVKNPWLINGSRTDTPEQLEQLRHQAAEYIGRLPALTEAERTIQEAWLKQIPEFGLADLINFRLYSEFSHPTLALPKLPRGATVAQVDEYTQTQGWLEFRFGRDIYQSGYYDNPGISECRLAPCALSEAVRRETIVMSRLATIASEYGVLVRTGSELEHLHLSVYHQAQDGAFRPIIGNAKPRQAATLDIAAGITAAFTDGVWLSPEDMKYKGVYIGEYATGVLMQLGPTRPSNVRILEDQLELRSRFTRADQAFVWLTAAALEGLQRGHEVFRQNGYVIPQVMGTWHIKRQKNSFNKKADLYIQRAFETAEWVPHTQAFVLSERYGSFESDTNAARQLASRLFDTVAAPQHSGFLNSIAYAAVVISEDGRIKVSTDKLYAMYHAFNPEHRAQADEVGMADIEAFAARLNDKFSVVEIVPAEAIMGEAIYRTNDETQAIGRISGSSIGQVALGPELSKYLSYLWQGA